jgi:hypothetical protein
LSTFPLNWPVFSSYFQLLWKIPISFYDFSLPINNKLSYSTLFRAKQFLKLLSQLWLAMICFSMKACLSVVRHKLNIFVWSLGIPSIYVLYSQQFHAISLLSVIKNLSYYVDNQSPWSVTFFQPSNPQIDIP